MELESSWLASPVMGFGGCIELWRDWRNRTGLRLHRAGRCVGQVVPGSQRINHRHRCRRFGAGALITAPLATRLIQTVGVLQTFAYLGIAFLIVTVISGAFMQNPPEGWKPEGWSPTATQAAQRRSGIIPFRKHSPVGSGGAVVPPFSEHLRGHFGDFAGSAALPGTGARECGCGRRHGRSGQSRNALGECFGLGLLTSSRAKRLFS